ncbi:MAG TPA: TrbI/VirB10 family protein [Rhizomicrobium sp.]|nr:TrbI/VirB10 family protein [Rhizomicrobium sp.]
MTEEALPGHSPQQQGQDAGPPDESRLDPNEMRLQGSRPPVTRLSRRVLVGGSAVALGGILVAFSFALWPRHQEATSQPVSTGANILPEGIAHLPKDYVAPPAAPKLGPPLPGDLGKPMLDAGVAPPAMSKPQTPQQQRIAQEQDAARTSHLFALTNPAPVSASPNPPPVATALPGAEQGTSDPVSAENMQANKIAFSKSGSNPKTLNPARVQRPVSPYIVQAGWVINAALAKGVKTDLPGEVRAQVTEDVYDSPTGHYLLIPQGAMLEGKYNSQVSFGQTRTQMVWTRLIFPNGNSIDLGHLPGSDAQGFSGVQDGVDEHWGSIFKAAVLSTVLSVGAEAGTSNTENNLAQAIRAGASQSINQAGEQIVQRNLNIQPTLTARFGLPVTVTVDRDLVLEPYLEKAASR